MPGSTKESLLAISITAVMIGVTTSFAFAGPTVRETENGCVRLEISNARASYAARVIHGTTWSRP